MKEIPLTRGLVALVDDEDFDRIASLKWHASKKGYATRNFMRKDGLGKQYKLPMHRYILGIDLHDPSTVDHIDGNKLNNQKANLRMCGLAGNMQNRPKTCRNTSGYKGVSWDKTCNKWSARIRCNGTSVYLGTFESASDAHKAYCQAAGDLHGEFARVV